MPGCSRADHSGHTPAPSFPSADVAHCRATRCPVRAVLPNRRYAWQKCWYTLRSAGCMPERAPPLANEPSRNWLVPPSAGLLPPNQMGTDVKCAGKYARTSAWSSRYKICLSYAASPHPNSERPLLGCVRRGKGITLF